MNPYQNLPARAFWRSAVADLSMFEVRDLWDPKFPIGSDMPVATYGSCFAQHFGKALAKRGFKWLLTERPPPGMSEGGARDFNYDVFTSRTGNIYTTSLLRQWAAWASGSDAVPDEHWEKDGRFYDPFRPAIEPEGFESLDELMASRDTAITAFRRAIRRSQCFVFTLGLTESWVNASRGYEYPMCPGTVAGEFDAADHHFVNQSHDTVRDNLLAAIALMRRVAPDLKFLLTVSPVPLTATRSDRHVVVATMYSKSVLRAVAGAVADADAGIDYFPSYEIINSPVFKGVFFGPNQRSVTPFGVDFVMNHFFGAMAGKFGRAEVESTPQGVGSTGRETKSDADVVCEEELLGAFGGRE